MSLWWDQSPGESGGDSCHLLVVSRHTPDSCHLPSMERPQQSKGWRKETLNEELRGGVVMKWVMQWADKLTFVSSHHQLCATDPSPPYNVRSFTRRILILKSHSFTKPAFNSASSSSLHIFIQKHLLLCTPKIPPKTGGFNSWKPRSTITTQNPASSWLIIFPSTTTTSPLLTMAAPIWISWINDPLLPSSHSFCMRNANVRSLSFLLWGGAAGSFWLKSRWFPAACNLQQV